IPLSKPLCLRALKANVSVHAFLDLDYITVGNTLDWTRNSLFKASFPSVVKEDLVGSQGVVFPSVVKEDLVRDPGCCSSLLVKEDQLSWVLYCP
ncbi:hypothetical protein Taro_025361, partial [Colocasia esculenta]|nr:hypothetical protein [Colocasia esculenta]